MSAEQDTALYDQPSSEPIATIWVCEDCMLYRETNQSPESGAPVWSALPFVDVQSDFDSDGDGMYEFAGTQCNACLTRAVGARFRYAVWDSDTDAPAVQS